jgi:hypothetical protein
VKQFKLTIAHGEEDAERLARSRSALTEEAFQALLRMKRDMLVVVAAASEYGSPADRAALKLILRNAAQGALRAFAADGAYRDPAWHHMVFLVDELLRHRVRLPAAGDRAELRRLHAFVNENRDVFEGARPFFVVRTAAT